MRRRLRWEVGDVAVADVHAPVVDPLEPGEAAQQGRLAAARGPEQDHELAVLHVEVDAVDRRELAEGLGTSSKRISAMSRAPLEPESFMSARDPPPRREQVLADEEDDHQRGRHQEEPAGEPIGSGEASSAPNTCAGSVRLLNVRIVAANTSFQDVTKMKIADAAMPGSASGSATRETPIGGCSRASSPPPRARTGSRRRCSP